jgi:general secretion pathway protein E
MSVFSRLSQFSRIRPHQPSVKPPSVPSDKTVVAPTKNKADSVDNQNGKPASNISKVIREMDDFPAGGIPLGCAEFALPASYYEKFLVLRFPTRLDYCATLVREDVFGSSDMFDMKRRANQEGYPHCDFFKSSAEIIKALRERESAVVSDMGTGEDASEFEKIGRRLVLDAVARKASDIHIETRDTFANCFFRIFGERVFIEQLSFNTAKGLASVMYKIHGDESSKGDSWYPEKVQETAFNLKSDGGSNIQVRFESTPIFPKGNFQVVMRILVLEENEAPEITSLGLEPDQVSELKSVVSQANGLLLVVGPVNSGKSTLCQAIIREQYKMLGQRIKVITGGFKSEVQHLPPSKVSRCKAVHPEGINSSRQRTA